MQQRHWNTIASLTVVVVLVYVFAAAAVLITGKIDFPTFAAALAPVATGLMGFMAKAASDSI